MRNLVQLFLVCFRELEITHSKNRWLSKQKTLVILVYQFCRFCENPPITPLIVMPKGRQINGGANIIILKVV